MLENNIVTDFCNCANRICMHLLDTHQAGTRHEKSNGVISLFKLKNIITKS